MSSGFSAYLLDELAPLGHVALRAMFSGHGLYLEGAMIAILIEDVLYLKVDARNRPDYQAAGSEPFTYRRQGRSVALSFWQVPDEVIENGEALRVWALKARGAAMAAARKPGPEAGGDAPASGREKVARRTASAKTGSPKSSSAKSSSAKSSSAKSGSAKSGSAKSRKRH